MAYIRLSETEGQLECYHRYAAWPPDINSSLITFDPHHGWTEPIAICFKVIFLRMCILLSVFFSPRQNMERFAIVVYWSF